MKTRKPIARSKAAAKAKAASKTKAKPASKTKAKPASKTKAKPASKSKAKAAPAPTPTGRARPDGTVLLGGGNPQVAKGDGDGPVREYISKLADWKHDLVTRIDALIGKTVPGVRRAVKWNSPFYGAPGGDDFFLGIHVMTKYAKLAFFRGQALEPIPPGESKSQDTRYLDIYETDDVDDALLAAWVKQASRLPGWSPRG